MVIWNLFIEIDIKKPANSHLNSLRHWNVSAYRRITCRYYSMDFRGIRLMNKLLSVRCETKLQRQKPGQGSEEESVDGCFIKSRLEKME